MQPANSNPWYILMTLNGEQDNEGGIVDRALHEKNKKDWNDYILSEVGNFRQMGQIEQSDIRAVSQRTTLDHYSEEKANENRKRIEESYSKEIQRRNKKNSKVLPKTLSELDFIEFSDLEFAHTLNCDGFLFPGYEIKIANCTFKGKAILSNTVFAPKVKIFGSTFEKGLDLSGSYQQSYFEIEDTEFASASEMRDCQFASSVIFKKLVASHGLDITRSEFSEYVEMIECEFYDDLHFTGSKFADQAHFRGCKMGSDESDSKSVMFNNVEFCNHVTFTFNDIKMDTNFSNAMFRRIAKFTRTCFSRGVSFHSASFDQHSYFSKCELSAADEFPGEKISFENCIFLAPVFFQETKFINRYPVLTGVSLPEETHFSADESYWPESIDQELDEVLATCSTIRHCYEKQGLLDDEHFFFRKEMDAKGKVGHWMYRLPFSLFKVVSNYGYSIARPTICLLVLWAFGFASNWGYLLGKGYPRPSDDIDHLFGTSFGAAFGFSFSNVFPVFGFRRIYFTYGFVEELPACLIFFASAQTVLGLPLLFLLVLAIRQRFRLR